MNTTISLILTLASSSALAAIGTMPPINVRTIIWNIFVLAGIAVCFGLADYAVSKAPFITEPIKAFIHWAIIVVCVVIVIFIILGFLGL